MNVASLPCIKFQMPNRRQGGSRKSGARGEVGSTGSSTATQEEEQV